MNRPTSEVRRLAEYERWLAHPRPSSVVLRWLMGRLGTFATNAPVFRLQENLRIEPSHRVLDIGCGRGSALRIVDERTHLERPPVGIDFSGTALRLARRDGLHAARPLDLARASATTMPFRNDAFDIILSGYLVKHLDDGEARRFFGELRRVLAPGGLALIWEFAPTGNPRLDGWNERVLSTGVLEPRLRSTRALMELGKLAGFGFIRDARLRPFLLPPIPRASVLLGKPPEGWVPS